MGRMENWINDGLLMHQQLSVIWRSPCRLPQPDERLRFNGVRWYLVSPNVSCSYPAISAEPEQTCILFELFMFWTSHTVSPSDIYWSSTNSLLYHCEYWINVPILGIVRVKETMVLLLRFTTSSYSSHIWSPAVYSIFIVCFLPIRLSNLTTQLS